MPRSRRPRAPPRHRRHNARPLLAESPVPRRGPLDYLFALFQCSTSVIFLSLLLYIAGGAAARGGDRERPETARPVQGEVDAHAEREAHRILPRRRRQIQVRFD